jgi:hypothetical protein
VRGLAPGNRKLSLATSGGGLEELARLGLDGLSTAERAHQLSTVSVYSGDGQRELEVSEPLRLVTLEGELVAGAGGSYLPAGTQIPARQHLVNTDEGRPT